MNTDRLAGLVAGIVLALCLIVLGASAINHSVDTFTDRLELVKETP